MRQLAAASAGSQERAGFETNGARRNLPAGEANVSGVTALAAYPSGSLHPATWVLPQKAGAMASRFEIEGAGSIVSASIAGGLNAVAALAGSGDITGAALGLIVQGVAAIAGTGALAADIVGKLDAAATIAGSGDLTAALGALADAVCSMSGTGSVAASVTATGSMSADITPFTELSPQALAASVWNAVAASYVAAGTMGEKMNSAASAGDPWSTAIPGAYAAGTAGHKLGSVPANVWSEILSGHVSGTTGANATAAKALLELFKLAGLDPTKPLVDDIPVSGDGSRAVDTDIEQTVSQTGTTTTVTRQ